MPRSALSTTYTGVSGQIVHARLIPHKTVTVSNLTFTSNSAATVVTLARFGIYTRSGTTFTLAARTASDTTIFNTANTKYTRALDTTGGYPATYTLTAGSEYYVSVIIVGSTAGSFLAGAGRSSTNANTATGPMHYSQSSQTDLVASSTGTISNNLGGLYVEAS